jgi:hypothetical protein
MHACRFFHFVHGRENYVWLIWVAKALIKCSWSNPRQSRTIRGLFVGHVLKIQSVFVNIKPLKFEMNFNIYKYLGIESIPSIHITKLHDRQICTIYIIEMIENDFPTLISSHLFLNGYHLLCSQNKWLICAKNSNQNIGGRSPHRFGNFWTGH